MNTSFSDHVVDNEVQSILKSKLTSKDHPHYPINAMHIWAENKPVNKILSRSVSVTLSDNGCVTIVRSVKTLPNLYRQSTF